MNGTECLERFRARVAALADGEPLQLEFGDLQAIASAVGRSAPHVHYAISGDTGRHVSAETVAEIEATVGVPLDRIRLQGKRGRPRDGAR